MTVRWSTISHEPYARYEVQRATVPADERHCCDNCGSRPGKFMYAILNDGIYTRRNLIIGEYCSIACMKDAQS